jgi:glutathione transport system ATP-binding protein
VQSTSINEIVEIVEMKGMLSKTSDPSDTRAHFPDSQVLSVEGLSVAFKTQDAVVNAVRDVSFSVGRGETLAIVGESGSGKSVTSLALMRLVEHGGGNIVGGSMRLRRHSGAVVELAQASSTTMRSIRGADVSMIFQEPMTSLNPVFTVGDQIAESIVLHQGKNAAQAKAEVLRLLERVRIAEAKHVFARYPHQLSGGMRQRVMIAMALSCQPALLIADEPTTALDVTVQAQILQLIRTLQDEMRMGVIFITHDMGVVAEVADRVLVMYKGAKVEEGDARQIFSAPVHPYTQALLAAVPKLGSMHGSDLPARFALLKMSETLDSSRAAAYADAKASTTMVAGAASVNPFDKTRTPILQVSDLVTRFPIKTGIFGRVTQQVHAVEHVSFDLYPGETLALVGESGCGKSTTGRSLLRLVDSQSGTIRFDGQDISALSGTALQTLRRHIQFIFQDPFASLNPRQTVGFSVMEPLLVHRVATRAEAEKRVAWLLDRVDLPPSAAQRYPHEFSGGQRQRIAIARALALNPQVVIADEAVSALDVSVQAQIVNLMLDLQAEFGLAYLFISHDMAVVERISHRVAVMYLGQIVEIGPRRSVFESPQHAYTRKLMRAVPVADPARRHDKRIIVDEDVPSAMRALGDNPMVAPLVEVAPGHYVAKHAVGGAY